MNSHSSVSKPTHNRRAFLKGLSALSAAPLFAVVPAQATPAKFAHTFELSAAGNVTDFSLVWPAPQVPPLTAGTVLRVRIHFPIDGRDVLEWQTYVAAENDLDESLWMATLFHMRVDSIGLSDTPAPNFGLFGQIIDNPIIDNPNHSPFGDLTGRVTTIYGQFDAPGDNTTFRLLGGAASGSHASAITTATGSLKVRGPWSF